MKRGIIIFINIIFLFGVLLSSIAVAAEEFKSCSQNSDCKVDSCNENSCINQSYQIPECVKPNLQAKECHCVENICTVLVGSVTPPAIIIPPGIITPVQPTGQPTVQPIQICTDSDNGNFYEKGIMKGAADELGHTDLCGDYNTLTEYYCENNGAKKTAFNCPNGCKDGACLKGEPISEQITCIFKNSDTKQKCYLSEDNSRFFCSGKDSCVMTVQGYKDEKMIWKSTCGSYIPTIIDGQNENAEFECKIGETTTTQIKNKGFRNVYFQCYDGEESKSTEREACKTVEFWKKFTENFCQSHCKDEKCGVNSFSVTNECYIEELIETPAISNNPKEIQQTQGMIYYFKSEDCSHCQEMDIEIGILKQKGFFNSFGIMVYNTKDKNIPEKFEIKTLPTIILYKDKCLFKKEGFMKSEEIENWAYESKCSEEIKEENESTAEPILVCKDSCALEGKCYPFGYRKGGKFCSDNGGFVEQLKGESTCDNSFECSSNVCVSGNCISEGLIQKVLNWFKRMFSG